MLKIGGKFNYLGLVRTVVKIEPSSLDIKEGERRVWFSEDKDDWVRLYFVLSNMISNGLSNDSQEGSRDNADKRDWSIVDYEALEPLVDVLKFGEKKYGRDNWKKGGKLFTSLSIMNSLLRHAFAIVRGETHDSESGLLHIGHIMCNCMFWSSLHGKK